MAPFWMKNVKHWFDSWLMPSPSSWPCKRVSSSKRCSIRRINGQRYFLEIFFSKFWKYIKHTRVENWLNQSQQDDLDDKESSIDSFQSLNEDIRTLRDENHKVFNFTIYDVIINHVKQLRDQLKQRECELQRKNERIKELERYHQHQQQQLQGQKQGKSTTKSNSSKSAFISMKI